ncbi:Beta-lactamase [Balamuthia mandrillaris]
MRKDVPSVTVPTTLVCGVLAAAVLLLAASTVEGLPGERAAAGFAARGGFPRLFGLQQNGASSFHSGGPPPTPTPPAVAAFKGCPVHPPPVPQVLLNANNIPSPLQHALEGLQKIILKNLAGLADPAVSVGVVYDQELIWGKGFGLVDPRDPSKGNATTDTIYRIGSITKLITDIMLMKLRDAGKVVLDDPVQKYVPAFTVQSPYPGKGLTWRSLASQVSGLAGGTPCDFFTLFEPIWNNACDITNEEAWRRISEQQVIAPMYTEPHYADSAYAIVGRALESVLPKGVTYEDYVTTEIFGPLGMGDSHFVLDNSVKTRLPPGYSLNVSIPDFVSHVDLNWARPTGQVYSTVRNLAKIASFFFVGAESNTIGIDPSSIREMLLPVFINPDMTGYGFPFEIYHTSLISSQLSSYWLRTKAGAIPGYTSTARRRPFLRLDFLKGMALSEERKTRERERDREREREQNNKDCALVLTTIFTF